MQTVGCFPVVVLLMVCTRSFASAGLLSSHPQQNDPSVIRLLNANNPPTPNHAEVIQELAKRLQVSQIKESRPYSFPAKWELDKGMYPSEIKVNFVGSPAMAEARDSFSVADNNMFATAWITVSILEAHLYGAAPRPTDPQLTLALEAIAQYHDKNRAYNNSVMAFWPQVYNASTRMWESTPTNLIRAFDVFDVVPPKVVEEILKLLGLTKLEKFLESMISMK